MPGQQPDSGQHPGQYSDRYSGLRPGPAEGPAREPRGFRLPDHEQPEHGRVSDKGAPEESGPLGRPASPDPAGHDDTATRQLPADGGRHRRTPGDGDSGDPLGGSGPVPPRPGDDGQGMEDNR